MTIFSRLAIGFLAIFIIAAVANVNSIMQLHTLQPITRSILNVDNRLIELETKMTDLLLSMVRNEKKFIITRDTELYDHFLIAKDDFDTLLAEAALTENTQEIKGLILGIEDHHKRYQFLFNEEADYLQSG